MNPLRTGFIGLFFLGILTGYAQNSIPKPPIHLLHVNELAFARYTTVWVKQDIDLKNHIRHEQLFNQLLPAHIKPRPESITLLFDSLYLASDPYRRAFLINTTSDTVFVNRADATLANVRTEVYVKNQWLVLQQDRGASCGNSYWKMPLPPNHHLVVQIEALSGSVKVPYQLIVKVNGKDVLSRPIMTDLNQPLLNLAGTVFSDPWK
ncbi:hypothetical protein [Spirosoma utsteinense]|uniref:GLPGLI family protein n=1 Tax=Spirosoma utsteinense TaxID=2585773 RepID=A0ABR6WBT8_9BACT|nr:hypothetical protein [Spirosoma utsteinense]MBC3789333.1 hypothetical protein [Spirosoma utsteinense]MBC3794028.1 hypothetical protein [Spirosoma utsteinense]